MGGSSSQPHTQQPISLIHSFRNEDMYEPEISFPNEDYQNTAREDYPVKSRPHHWHRPNRSRLEDAKRGRLKTRTRPSALHGPMRKKLRCVKVEFTYPKIAPLVTRGRRLDFGVRFYGTWTAEQSNPVASEAGDEDYFTMVLLDY
ncbi:hypothetical protein Tco_1067084 [Tanacetum coccineum]|uniref:Uncharacterized protein n=1 Tax=Tanacetum coccineum TaxID=301880 RepID=A0ABQ5HBY2_9ASTR